MLRVHTEAHVRRYPGGADTRGDYVPVIREAHRVLAYVPETSTDHATVTISIAEHGIECVECEGHGCGECSHECVLAEGDDSVERWAVEHRGPGAEQHERESARVVLDALREAEEAGEGAAA